MYYRGSHFPRLIILTAKRYRVQLFMPVHFSIHLLIFKGLCILLQIDWAHYSVCGPPSQGPPPRWLHTDCQRVTCTSPTFPPKSELHKLALSEHRCCINDGWDGVCGSVARIFRRAHCRAAQCAAALSPLPALKALNILPHYLTAIKASLWKGRLCKVIICGKAWKLHFW